MFQNVSLHESFLSLISFHSPFGAGLELFWLHWQVIPQLPSEDDLAGAEPRDRVCLVAVDEEGAGETVSVHGPAGGDVVHDEAAGRLHTDFRSLVSTGVVCSGDTVSYAVSC